MTTLRYPAVAGLFYPETARDLEAQVRNLLAAAAPAGTASPTVDDPILKAIIVPHAGYPYSGPVAATAYARVAAIADRVCRVVLLGPSHRVAVRGLAASSAAAFTTPLGPVPVDRAALASVLALPQVETLDAAHADEHSLEVHLPFLQAVLKDFTIVPLLVGRASTDAVAEVLDRLWGGPETLIVISSDLSHYLDDASARALDAATCRAIEALEPAAIGHDQACGRVPINGLLTLARRRGLSITTLDLRNSGDTAGDRRRVVGYGAWMLSEPGVVRARPRTSTAEISDAGPSPEAVASHHGENLLKLAAASIRHGLEHGRPIAVCHRDQATELLAPGACFVTLRHDGNLRGCIGSPLPYRPLAEDVAANAFAAAFRDSRFPRLHRRERDRLSLSVSILGRAERLDAERERDLLRLLRPGIDGVIIASEGRQALFLPQVWHVLKHPADFIGQLKIKAGLEPACWPDDLRAWRFSAVSVSSDALAEPASVWS
ncbi:MAG: AmmeMemoRadiSam system protein B [Rhodospirillales bacterium]|nr:MAG: AmmeMemoRadiSam system protein B [Rhodospirillales bacterium]